MHALRDSGSNQAMLEDQKEYGAKQGLISTFGGQWLHYGFVGKHQLKGPS